MEILESDDSSGSDFEPSDESSSNDDYESYDDCNNIVILMPIPMMNQMTRVIILLFLVPILIMLFGLNHVVHLLHGLLYLMTVNLKCWLIWNLVVHK